MALRPEIILAAQAPDIQEELNQRLQNQALQAGIFEQLQQAPVRQQQLEAGLENTQLKNQAIQAEMAEAERQRQLRSIARGYKGAKQFLDKNDFEGAKRFLDSRIEDLLEQGVTDISDTQGLRDALEAQDAEAINFFKVSGETILQQAIDEGLMGDLDEKTAETRTFEALTADFTPEEKLKAAKVKARISPPAGTSAAERIAEEGKTGLIASSQAVIEGEKAAAKETAKLSAQLKLKPEVESAVTTAVAKAKVDIEAIGEQKDNQTTLNVYDAAMSGLVEALGGTITGPVAGWLPALTADQQIADGAVAAMAPVLKQLFRGSGEGTFTDKDQELLLQMVPTRKDTPEARIAKLQNIDAIVRAKLGQAVPRETSTQGSPARRRRFNPETGRIE